MTNGEIKNVEFGVSSSEMNQSLIEIMFTIPLWMRIMAPLLGLVIVGCIVTTILKFIDPDFFKIKKKEFYFEKQNLEIRSNKSESILMLSKKEESIPSIPVIKVQYLYI